MWASQRSGNTLDFFYLIFFLRFIYLLKDRVREGRERQGGKVERGARERKREHRREGDVYSSLGLLSTWAQ